MSRILGAMCTSYTPLKKSPKRPQNTTRILPTKGSSSSNPEKAVNTMTDSSKNPERSGSVFYHLHEDDKARDLELRANVLMAIQEYVKAAQMSQAEVMKITGLQQSDVSYLLNGKISRFKLDRLVTIAKKFNATVKVIVDFPAVDSAIGSN